VFHSPTKTWRCMDASKYSMEVGYQLHAPAALPPARDCWFPLDRTQTPSGRCREEENQLPMPGLESLGAPHILVSVSSELNWKRSDKFTFNFSCRPISQFLTWPATPCRKPQNRLDHQLHSSILQCWAALCEAGSIRSLMSSSEAKRTEARLRRANKTITFIY
jgi:hypothetical protein